MMTMINQQLCNEKYKQRKMFILLGQSFINSFGRCFGTFFAQNFGRKIFHSLNFGTFGKIVFLNIKHNSMIGHIKNLFFAQSWWLDLWTDKSVWNWKFRVLVKLREKIKKKLQNWIKMMTKDDKTHDDQDGTMMKR